MFGWYIKKKSDGCTVKICSISRSGMKIRFYGHAWRSTEYHMSMISVNRNVYIKCDIMRRRVCVGSDPIL